MLAINNKHNNRRVLLQVVFRFGIDFFDYSFMIW